MSKRISILLLFVIFWRNVSKRYSVIGVHKHALVVGYYSEPELSRQKISGVIVRCDMLPGPKTEHANGEYGCCDITAYKHTLVVCHSLEECKQKYNH